MTEQEKWEIANNSGKLKKSGLNTPSKNSPKETNSSGKSENKTTTAQTADTASSTNTPPETATPSSLPTDTVSLLEQNYNIAKDSLDASKQRSQQNANVTLEKLKKYLPEYVKSQGMGGTGMSETSLLQAYNDYSRNMSDIESSYQQQHNELLSNYNTAKLEKETAAQDNLYQVEMTNLKNLYDSLKGTDGKISNADYDKLSNYIEEIRGSIGEDNYNLAQAVLEGYKQNKRADEGSDEWYSEQAKAAKTVENVVMEDEDTSNGAYGDHFSFEYNGQRVSVKKGEPVSESTKAIFNDKFEAKNAAPKYGDAIVYNGTLHMYLSNGAGGYAWYKVYKRGDSDDEKRIDDIITAYK